MIKRFVPLINRQKLCGLIATIWMVAISLSMLTACYRLPVPLATTVNPETFPQAIPEGVNRVPENPPPLVTENRTFVTIDGAPVYRIGPGDALDILITRGTVQDRIQAIVRANGRISVLMVEVSADGRTADQVGLEIAQELSRYLRHPVVDVSVKEYNSKKLSVLGAIGQTGRGAVLPLMGRTTLVDVIARVGGLGPTARTEEIRIARGNMTYSVNMFRYFQEDNQPPDAVLDAGDVVLIPERARDEEQRVFVLGEVKSPGPVPFRPRMTVGQLVMQIGGWTDGARIQEARIIRGDLKNPEVIGIDLNRLILDGDRRIDQYLMPNDVVLIPRTSIADWNSYLAQLRPTLEFVVLGLQPYVIYRTIK